MEQEYLTKTETAAYLGMSMATLWRLIRAGKVQVRQFGEIARIKKSDLDQDASLYLVTHLRTTTCREKLVGAFSNWDDARVYIDSRPPCPWDNENCIGLNDMDNLGYGGFY